MSNKQKQSTTDVNQQNLPAPLKSETRRLRIVLYVHIKCMVFICDTMLKTLFWTAGRTHDFPQPTLNFIRAYLLWARDQFGSVLRTCNDTEAFHGSRLVKSLCVCLQTHWHSSIIYERASKLVSYSDFSTFLCRNPA
ncbi:hypothetical protein EV356DRAFT_175489 [Viridothelium virens]|uniref:Uncharacterized protein n=1 Tax=Viridothelium virens TaxID=1048519 RepID=A0A6A6H8A4_VIRVR|nr:hypothetical protein EV356DRAFT_175489 [Viridothelium virens]